MNDINCHITKMPLKPEEAHKGDFIKSAVFKLIQNDYPDFTRDSYICIDELNRYRKIYLSRLIRKEAGELNKLEREVVDAISKDEMLSKNIEIDIDDNLTFGQKAADVIARFGGSWAFILFFFSFIIFWVAMNFWFYTVNSFDPYPFILLNLILSCLAAIQAPIIIMSQNRFDEKDRKRGEHDYKVNLKAELEIRLLHEKVDHLILHQYKRMLDVQELQMDYLEDILNEVQ